MISEPFAGARRRRSLSSTIRLSKKGRGRACKQEVESCRLQPNVLPKNGYFGLSLGFHQKGGLRVNAGKLLFSSGICGALDLKQHRPIPANAAIKSVTFTKKGRHWRVALAIEVVTPIVHARPDAACGVDVGVEALAAPSRQLTFVASGANDRIDSLFFICSHVGMARIDEEALSLHLEDALAGTAPRLLDDLGNSDWYRRSAAVADIARQLAERLRCFDIQFDEPGLRSSAQPFLFPSDLGPMG